jgi:hypothetical protein
MDHSDPAADEIRRQMQITRQRVRDDVGNVVEGARQLGDWRYYARQFPWAMLGTAAVVGYTVVPRRVDWPSSAAQSLEEVLKKDHLHATTAPPAVKQGLAATLAATAGSALLKMGIDYAGRELGRRLHHSYGGHVEELPA